MRIIQLPPVVSSRGHTPPSTKQNGADNAAAPAKHFLVINPTRRLGDNNNTRKPTSPHALPARAAPGVPTCERLDQRGVRSFLTGAPALHPSGENGLTSLGNGRFQNEADKENATPAADGAVVAAEEEGDESHVTAGPGHVRNMIARFSSPDGACVGDHQRESRSRSMSPEGQGGASPVANGSEPSLGSRNDNHVTSSVNASKRTLVSQENMSPSNRPVTTTNSAHAHHGLPDNPEGATTGGLDLQGSPEVMTLNFENSPAKTPSYLNASRLASGYTPYSSYTPVLQAKSIRATRQAEEDSQSDSSLHTSTPKMADSESRVTLQGQAEGHQSDQPISNGHSVGGAGDDDVDSSRIVSDNSVSGDNVQGMTSRTRNSTSRPSNGDLVGSRLSQGEGRLGDKENGLAEDDMRLNLTVGRREDQLNPVTSPDTPAKDGHYFIDVMRREEKRLNELCEAAEVDLQNNHSEDVNGKLRAAIGKANLLTTKKFKQFKGLCEKCNEPDETDPFPILPKDLVGFWDMVSIQVDDVTMMFKEIERMRLSGWTKVQTPTTTAKSSVAKGTARKSPRSKAMSNQSKRAQEASRARDLAREEARKRLLAAKKAGRMRKRSNSDKEEIEIYVQ